MEEKVLDFERKAAVGTLATGASEGPVLRVWCGFVARTLINDQIEKCLCARQMVNKPGRTLPSELQRRLAAASHALRAASLPLRVAAIPWLIASRRGLQCRGWHFQHQGPWIFLLECGRGTG